MVAFIVGARVLLALVFGVAGVSKLAAPRSARNGLVEFGVPAQIAGAASSLLIAAELAVAVAMIAAGTAWYGALGAAALLTMFCTAIASNLLRNRHPNCNCFGQLSAAPVGWPTLARNAVLLGFAVAIIGAGRDAGAASVIGWLGQLITTQGLLLGAVLGAAAAVLVMVLLMQIVQQQGRILLRLEALEQQLGVGLPANGHAETPAGLSPGSDSPSFALNDLTGRTVELATLLDSPMALLLFSHPDCHPCQELLPDVIAWQRELAPAVKIAVIAEGSAETNREKFAARGVDLVLLQKEREVAERYGAYGTPSAVAVAADGRITSFVAQGAAAIRSLVEEVRAGTLPALPPKVEVPRIGDPVPDVKLVTLAGEPFAFSQLSGTAALLLFWNQSCGYCQRMLPELRASESKTNGSKPQWIVLVNGSPADGAALGVRSTIILDENGRAARAFGASGTPMALLLDRDGRVASDLAVGADEIFDLADGRKR